MPRSMFALLLCVSTTAVAQSVAPPSNSQPVAIARTETIPAARDVAFPGTIRLDVDATDVERGIWKVREIIPVPAVGQMTLLFPEWLPGSHAPRGQIDKLAQLSIRAGGRELAWRRDPADVYAFHVDVPAGATELDVSFQFLSATASDQGRVVATREMLNLQWEAVSLYPAGFYTRNIPVSATVTYPTGWKVATALRPAGAAQGNRVTYQTVGYDVLQDSPVFAGAHFRADDLGHGVTLNSIADHPKELQIPAEVLQKHRNLVTQAVKLFGARHFDHYDFLHAVTERMGGIGLEHQRSSENQNDPGYFINWSGSLMDHNLLPHELVHSWNGKFRRGADSFTPDFRTPIGNSLLWVYEGQTQFWGYVLEARSGMTSKQDVLDKLAMIAASLDSARAGRQWRNLQDTVYDPIISARRPKGWTSWQRSEDYYNEGLLIWMEADAIIREGTRNRRGMDDFARAFFGVRDGDWGTLTYTFDNVVKTLEGVHPYDWRSFLDERLNRTSQNAPLGGFTRSGYRLEFDEKPTAAQTASMGKSTDLFYSLGLNIDKDAKITSINWGGPAFASGLTVGQTVVAVDGRSYSPDVIKERVTAVKGGTAPVRLTVKRGEVVRDVQVRWNGGLRYPRFQKVGKGTGALDILLEPR